MMTFLNEKLMDLIALRTARRLGGMESGDQEAGWDGVRIPGVWVAWSQETRRLGVMESHFSKFLGSN